LPLQATNGIAGTWAPAFNSQQSGTYNFTPNTYTVMSGCPASITHNITIVAALSPSFALPSSVCIGSNLNFPSVSTEGIAGLWAPAFNNQSTTSYTFTPSTGGITYTNVGAGCPVPMNQTVAITNPVTPSFTLPDSICEGATVTLPLVSNNGVAGTWAPAFNNQATTIYTFTPDANQCPITAQQTIVVSTLYDPTFSLPSAICQNETLALPLISDNGVSGTWSPAFSSAQSGSYTYVFVPNAAVCAYDYQYNLAVNPTHASFDTVTICQSQLPFVWYGQSLNGTTSTSTTFQNQYGCDSILNLHLIVNPSPVVDFSIPSWESCLPATIAFANNQVEANTIYNWAFGNGVTSSAASLLSNTYTQPGCYDVSLTAINQFGCATTNTFLDGVCIEPNPVASFTVQNNPLPIIQTTTLLQNTSQNASSVVWDFGHDAQVSSTFSPIHTFPERAGSYLVTLIIQNANGCIDSTFEVIQIEQDPIYYVPNAFTPNGSELNNIFLPVFSPSLSLSSYQLQIFNRWGQTVFESRDPGKGWDGTIAKSNGASMSQDGVYTYKISFVETGFEKEFVVTGSVSLVR
jgi:gliding motility-associated-like protein